MKKFGFLSLYKIPLLISLTLIIALLATTLVSKPLPILMIVVGAFLGTFVLDLEYVLLVYFFEPQSEFSKVLVSFIKHRDFTNVAQYINLHKHGIKDKSLNSAVFQIIIAAVSVFVISSNALLILKALMLSVFASSMYKLAESYFENKTDEWFWALKTPPTKSTILIYAFVLMVVFSYCLYLL